MTEYDGARAPAGGTSMYSAEALNEKFWTEFSDPVLDDLVAQALAANHDLRIALTRLREARALRRSAFYDFLPTITGSGGRTNVLTPLAQTPNLTREQRSSDTYDATFDAAWELDLFGRTRRGNQAAQAEVAAAAAGWQFSQVTVAAEVTRTYLELRGLQAQLGVATRNAENLLTTLELTNKRLAAGRGTELDSARARAQLNITRAAIPTLEASVAQAIYRLGVLTGRLPTALQAQLATPSELPPPPAITRIGAPAELLRRRPDVRVAERQLAAATARVGVAAADFFPRITFIGQGGGRASDSQNLLSAPNDFYSFGPRLTWAFLDLGRVRERVVQSRASAERALVAYEQTVLRAIEETESALISHDRAKRSTEWLRQAATDSRMARDLAKLRFEGGIADFLVVLDAERSLLETETQLAISRTAESTSLVAVYKALGGGWSEPPQ
jgi:multidrug efflux system outer membrane protein